MHWGRQGKFRSYDYFLLSIVLIVTLALLSQVLFWFSAVRWVSQKNGQKPVSAGTAEILREASPAFAKILVVQQQTLKGSPGSTPQSPISENPLPPGKGDQVREDLPQWEDQIRGYTEDVRWVSRLRKLEKTYASGDSPLRKAMALYFVAQESSTPSSEELELKHFALDVLLTNRARLKPDLLDAAQQLSRVRGASPTKTRFSELLLQIQSASEGEDWSEVLGVLNTPPAE